MTRYAKHMFPVVLLLLLNASLALGASVSVSASGDGVFVITGNSMDGVGGIDLRVDYDSSSLGSPTVSQGSLVSERAMFAPNPNYGSSTIKIGIVSHPALAGSGRIAVITFAAHTGTGSVTVTNSMIDSHSVPLPGGGKSSATDFQTSTTNTSGSTTTAGTSSSQSATTTASSSTSTISTSSMPTYLGTVSMPSDAQAGNDTKPAGTTAAPVQPAESETAKRIEAPAEEKPVIKQQNPETINKISYKGTLENFRAYKGKKSPATLVALFKGSIAPAIRQEPAAALSDGKTPVKILAKLETTDEKMPSFTLNGAKLISLNRDNASTWIIEVLPKEKITQSSITILTSSERIEYPLTLAPPIKGISLAEADFAVFLKDSGAATPKRDLNGDGKHDYLDDFIYTANYLVNRGAAGKAKK